MSRWQQGLRFGDVDGGVYDAFSWTKSRIRDAYDFSRSVLGPIRRNGADDACDDVYDVRDDCEWLK